MQGVKVSIRYAKSLLDLAVERKETDRVFADMSLVNSACRSSRELTMMLKSPIIKTDKKIKVLNEIFGKLLTPVSMQFLGIIASKKREMYLPEIASSFISQYKNLKNIRTAEIVTAAPLGDTLYNEVLRIVKDYTQTEVELQQKVNPELIGGYVLTVEGEQDDTSIRTKIGKLRRAFRENLYQKDY